jgi:hypothetical protein
MEAEHMCVKRLGTPTLIFFQWLSTNVAFFVLTWHIACLDPLSSLRWFQTHLRFPDPDTFPHWLDSISSNLITLRVWTVGGGVGGRCLCFILGGTSSATENPGTSTLLVDWSKPPHTRKQKSKSPGLQGKPRNSGFCSLEWPSSPGVIP